MKPLAVLFKGCFCFRGMRAGDFKCHLGGGECSRSQVGGFQLPVGFFGRGIPGSRIDYIILNRWENGRAFYQSGELLGVCDYRMENRLS